MPSSEGLGSVMKKYRIIKRLNCCGTYDYVVQRKVMFLFWEEVDSGWYGSGSTYSTLSDAENKLVSVIDAEKRYTSACKAKSEVVKEVSVTYER